MSEPGLITELQPISARSPMIAPNFFKPRRHQPFRRRDRDLAAVELHIGKNHARAEVAAIADDRVADVVEMRDLRFVEDDRSS